MLNDEAIDLTGAMVSFILKNPSGSILIKAAATITDAATGQVEYQPTADNMANAGTFSQEWEIVFSDDSILTVPNDGYNEVQIIPDLG